MDSKGKPGTTDESAVVLAAKRAFPGCKVEELPAVIIVTPTEGHPVWYELPDAARALTDKLERGAWEWTEPITFQVTRWDRPPRKPTTTSSSIFRWTV